MSTPVPTQLFADQQLQPLLALLEACSDEQKLWLSGYLAGSLSADTNIPEFSLTSNTNLQPAVASTGRSAPVTIAFGTETDNCRTLARALAERCQTAGIATDVVDLANLRVRKLLRLQHLVVITATHGDGDPPEPIADFYETLMADDAPPLKDLQFAVLALGDSTYEQFCVTGQQIDQRLEALGGKRLLARRDCDVDFQQPADQWFTELLPHLPSAVADTQASAAPTQAAQGTLNKGTNNKESYSKNQPLLVEVIANHNLSSAQRQQPNHHLVLELPVTDFPLQPGDAIGVLPENPPELVAALLDHTGLSGEQPVTLHDRAMPLVEALRAHCDLTIPSRNFLSLWAELCQDSALQEVVTGNSTAQRGFLKQHQILDLILQYPARPQAQVLVDALRPLQPRLYDAANSLAVVDDELHLTVKDFRYPFRERQENGITSRFLLELQPGDSVLVYPHRNARFHLPDDPSAPLIFIGEGTGVAPYRAFLQQLSLLDTPPPCWLVFAEDSFEEDFLYQLDLQHSLDKGVLQQLDTVFYRDQADAELATPLLNQVSQLAEWVDQGGHIYLGGEKESLELCEARLTVCLDDISGQGSWQALAKAKRVHRNVY